MRSADHLIYCTERLLKPVQVGVNPQVGHLAVAAPQHRASLDGEERVVLARVRHDRFGDSDCSKRSKRERAARLSCFLIGFEARGEPMQSAGRPALNLFPHRLRE